MANMAQAIRMALAYGEQNLGITDIFGEDVGPPLGGVFTATQGLKTSWNTPLDERGIVGMMIGLALAGQKPVAEIQFCDYIFNTIDLLKIAGNMCWSSAGDYNINCVLMTPVGSGIHGSIYHSHSFDAIATHLPGWKIVFPSTPIDAYGLMLAALKDPNPVMFMKPKALMRTKGEELIPGEPEDAKELSRMIDKPLKESANWKPTWPKLQDYTVPLGKARITRSGSAATVVSYGRTMPLVNKVADQLREQDGVEVECIDLRTLIPYDWECISESIRKTRKVLFVNEDTEVTNFGEHLIRRTVTEFFDILEARPRLLAGDHLPGVGLAPQLEFATQPQEAQILREIRAMVEEQA